MISFGLLQEEQIQQAICHQFSVNEVKQLGHGATSRLIGLADRPGKHVSNHHCVVYEAAVLPSEGWVSFFSFKGTIKYRYKVVFFPVIFAQSHYSILFSIKPVLNLPNDNDGKCCINFPVRTVVFSQIQSMNCCRIKMFK